MISRAIFNLVPKTVLRKQAPFFLAVTSTFNRRFATLEEGTVEFPRKGINVALNWALARHLVTPYHNVAHNSVSGGSKDGSKTQVVAVGGNLNAKQFRDINVRLAKTLSSSSTVYVEDGELNGLFVRIVAADEAHAKSARGALNKASDSNFKPNVTVLLGNDASLAGKTLVDPSRGVVLSSSANNESLKEALALIAK